MLHGNDRIIGVVTLRIATGSKLKRPLVKPELKTDSLSVENVDL